MLHHMFETFFVYRWAPLHLRATFLSPFMSVSDYVIMMWIVCHVDILCLSASYNRLIWFLSFSSLAIVFHSDISEVVALTNTPFVVWCMFKKSEVNVSFAVFLGEIEFPWIVVSVVVVLSLKSVFTKTLEIPQSSRHVVDFRVINAVFKHIPHKEILR